MEKVKKKKNLELGGQQAKVSKKFCVCVCSEANLEWYLPASRHDMFKEDSEENGSWKGLM
jgi:hypothetical protein